MFTTGVLWLGSVALKFGPELLYAGATFHDIGLPHQHSSNHERFEVDGANAARGFLRGHDIAQHDIDTVWTAIALHTTPGIPQHMHPVVAPPCDPESERGGTPYVMFVIETPSKRLTPG